MDGTSKSETGRTGFSYPTPGRVQMLAGQQIRFTMSMTETAGHSDNIQFSMLNNGITSSLGIVHLAANGTISLVVSFTAPAYGRYNFRYNSGITTLNTTISTSCGIANPNYPDGVQVANPHHQDAIQSTSQNHQDAVQSANHVSNIQQQQTNNLVTGRIHQLSKNVRPNNSSNRSLPEFQPETSDQNAGANAGAPNYSNGLWGNLAMTHSQDRHQASAYSGIQGSAVIGLDTRMTDSLLIGAAINMEYATLSRNNKQMQFSSSGLGLSPYISYQIDDIFSLSSLANITYTNNHSGFSNGARIDQESVRWNFALQGDGFWNWDNWGLLAGLGLSYGQTHLFATKDNNGIDVTGQTTRLGTAQLTLQPSYYWQYNRDLGLEPYLLSQYNYDYSMTKISTSATQSSHPNDQDAFRLGIGLNLFGSNFYSGNIEASTVLGRDNYSEASISGNIRVQF